jgi:hypothetical protein
VLTEHSGYYSTGYSHSTRTLPTFLSGSRACISIPIRSAPCCTWQHKRDTHTCTWRCNARLAYNVHLSYNARVPGRPRCSDAHAITISPRVATTPARSLSTCAATTHRTRGLPRRGAARCARVRASRALSPTGSSAATSSASARSRAQTAPCRTSAHGPDCRPRVCANGRACECASVWD